SVNILLPDGIDAGHWVGTPNVVTSGQYYVTYNSYNTSTGHIDRRLAVGTSLTALRKVGVIMNYNTTNWLSSGPGEGSVMYENGYWYMIVEGFGGANPPACNNTNSELGISLARSSDLVNWTWSPMSPLR